MSLVKTISRYVGSRLIAGNGSIYPLRQLPRTRPLSSTPLPTKIPSSHSFSNVPKQLIIIPRIIPIQSHSFIPKTNTSQSFHAQFSFTRTFFTSLKRDAYGKRSSSFGKKLVKTDNEDTSGGSRGGYEYFHTVGEPFYMRKNFWIGTGACGVVIGIYYVTHLDTVPVSNRTRFMDCSPEEETKLARQAYNMTMQQYGNRILPAYHPYTQFVRRVASRLITAGGMEDLKWEFYVIDSPEMNAFVLPGGKVFVFTGLIPVVQNDDGMAVILGHEIAHQFARHSAEKLSVTRVLLIARVLLSFVLDSSTRSLNALFFQFGMLMPFSRKCEVEADYIGLLLMSQACYDPTAALDVWKRMKSASRSRTPGSSSSSPPEYMSTHPSHDSRIENIQKWMPEAMDKRHQSDCQEQLGGLMRLFKKEWVKW